MPAKHVYNPAIPLEGEYEPEVDESVNHTLKVADASGVDWSSKIKWPIIHFESKGKAFLHFIFKLSSARELMTWDEDGKNLISKFELRFQGSYQTGW
jgi:hypothetical protein